MDDTLDIITDVLRNLHFVRLGIVFGSLASGRADSESDVDLAVAGDQPLTSSQKMAVIESIADAMGRPVDVVDLLADGGPILRQAIVTGRRIYGDDPELYARVLNRMTAHEADVMPYYNRILEQRRRKWIGV